MDKETQEAFKTLGGLVTEGFKHTATKQELEPIREDIAEMKNDIARIKSDIHYIHNDTKTIPDLFNLIKEQDEDIEAIKA